MATTYSVTTSFSSDTTAIGSEVNQNFTDVLTALNSFDITNTTGTIALARISDLTATQMASTFFKDEDNMASDSATAVASQQSIKAHVTASSTDGYTPTTYANEESVTYPNGFIEKNGYSTASANTILITFEDAFPTAIKNVQITNLVSVATYSQYVANTVTTSSFYATIDSTTSITGFYWTAKGY